MKSDHITTNPDYQSWLHELTVEGYDRGIMISAGHQDAVMAIWALRDKNGDIGNDFDHYEDFLRRWKALGGDNKQVTL